MITVAHEESKQNDLRAILGNKAAVQAFRKRPFPDGTIIARLAWDYVSSAENNKAFGQQQSFVAGHPKNGLQFMVKDTKKYALTGGWGYVKVNDGKPASNQVHATCAPCHERA
ncbi:cytochrome P460 family protein [Spirosoma profusum]|uniref:cytochrome P460 family protein n=1 Tax=Spirosoma profusum TaxID=2771354 RepID=UPI001CC22C30|nr:cytochrome P460 family protein [Spirosoma profusum]